MKKSLTALAVLAAIFSNAAFAANEFADGQEVVLKDYSGNFYAGQYLVNGGNPDFNAQSQYYFRTEGQAKTAVDNSLNTHVTLTGKLTDGDLVGGNGLRGLHPGTVKDEYKDMSINSTTVIVDGGSVAENLIGGTKIVNYDDAGIKADVGSVTVIVRNGTVNGATVIGSMNKSTQAAQSMIKNATVTVENSTLNGLILGGVAAQIGDPSKGEFISSVESVTMTMSGSTINKMRNGVAITGVATTGLADTAIVLGGVAKSLETNEITSNSNVANVVLNVSDTTIDGDVVMGGYSEGSNSGVKVENSQIVLGDGATITGQLNSGNMESASGLVTSSEIAKATITIASSNVKIEKGVSVVGKNVGVEGTGNFNDEHTNAANAIAKLQAITKLETGDSTFTVAEGMYNNGGELDTSGNFVERTNTVMRDTLDLATGTTFSLNRILMNDVRKRMGDLRSSEGKSGAWARYDGGRLSGEGLDNDFNTIQVGVDTVPTDNGIRFGIAASYTNGDADYTRGSADMDAYGLAFYGTWMGDSGLFADVVARMAKADTDVTIDGNKKGSMDNVALSLSGEVGYRYDVTKTFFVEPQAELAYTYVDADTLKLSDGSSYEYDAADSLIARIGAVVGLSCPNDMGSVYARVSAVHEFLGDTTVTGANGAKLTNDGKDTWVEFGVGAQYNINPATYVWADVERTEGAALDEDWRATVGVRYAF